MGVNRFKEGLRTGQKQIGLWCSLGSPVLAEIIADAGYDWLLLDTEHAPTEAADVLAQLQAMRGAAGEAIVRPPWNDPVAIKRLMDLGARTLLIPMVQNAEEAARAVKATRYPPAGVRGVASMPRAAGYGRTPDYHRNAAEEACVLVQIETRAALANLEAIAAVDGVDGLFVGPSDLSADMGHLGEPRHPEVQAAIADAGRRILAAGKAAGILTGVEADAIRYLEMGYRFVAVGSDLGLLASACSGLLERMRAARV